MGKIYKHTQARVRMERGAEIRTLVSGPIQEAVHGFGGLHHPTIPLSLAVPQLVSALYPLSGHKTFHPRGSEHLPGPDVRPVCQGFWWSSAVFLSLVLSVRGHLSGAQDPLPTSRSCRVTACLLPLVGRINTPRRLSTNLGLTLV